MFGRSGSTLVVALLAVLVLSAVGLMVSITVSEDMQIAGNHLEMTQCLYIAEAGLAHAMAKLESDWNWTGLPPPGRVVGPGTFTVAVSDSADGAPLSSGQKRIDVKARVGATEREIEVIVQ